MKSKNKFSSVNKIVLVYQFLSLYCLNISVANASYFFVEGKCVIPETGDVYPKCGIINDGSSLTIVAGRGKNLIKKIPISDIYRSGRLTADFETSSPLLKSRINSSLSEIQTDRSDAIQSNNVRAIQVNDNGSFYTVILIADRNKNLESLSSLIPNQYPNPIAGSKLLFDDAQKILKDFERQFERVDSLYSELMFEEGDRALDLAAAKAILFKQRFGNKEGVLEVEKYLQSQIRQLIALRNFKNSERLLEEVNAEKEYDKAQKKLAVEQLKRQEYFYKLAVEYRKTAEANALKWYAIWAGRPSNNIYIIR